MCARYSTLMDQVRVYDGMTIAIGKALFSLQLNCVMRERAGRFDRMICVIISKILSIQHFYQENFMPRLALADPKTAGAPNINIFKGIANAPEILKGYLGFNVAVKKHGGLSPAEIEMIALVVAQEYDCHYCLNAHTQIAKGVGLDEAHTVGLRKGQGANPREQAIVDFARAVIATKGYVSDEILQQVRAAGLMDEQITAMVAMIGIAIFTALFNHVNDTASDFPEAPKL